MIHELTVQKFFIFEWKSVFSVFGESISSIMKKGKRIVALICWKVGVKFGEIGLTIGFNVFPVNLDMIITISSFIKSLGFFVEQSLDLPLVFMEKSKCVHKLMEWATASMTTVAKTDFLVVIDSTDVRPTSGTGSNNVQSARHQIFFISLFEFKTLAKFFIHESEMTTNLILNIVLKLF